MTLGEDLRDDPLLRAAPIIRNYKCLPPCALMAKLGEGGFGKVYRGYHGRLGIDVAVKCLFPQFAADSAYLARFAREAQFGAAITHTNVVHVFDFVGAFGLYYLVMELVRGETARERAHSARALCPNAKRWVSWCRPRRVSPQCMPATWCTATSSPRTCSSDVTAP